MAVISHNIQTDPIMRTMNYKTSCLSSLVFYHDIICTENGEVFRVKVNIADPFRLSSYQKDLNEPLRYLETDEQVILEELAKRYPDKNYIKKSKSLPENIETIRLENLL